jgi:hypothetical protein
MFSQEGDQTPQALTSFPFLFFISPFLLVFCHDKGYVSSSIVVTRRSWCCAVLLAIVLKGTRVVNFFSRKKEAQRLEEKRGCH